MNESYIIGIVMPKYIITTTMNILEYGLDTENLNKQESQREIDKVKLETMDELKSKLMHGRNSNIIY